MYKKVLCLVLVVSMLAALSCSVFALEKQDAFYIQNIETGLCRKFSGEEMLIPALAYMGESVLPLSTTVADEDLIAATGNPSNGVLSIRLKVPAGATATYSVDLIPNNHNESIDHKSGSYENTTTATTTVTVRVNVNYYTQDYIISAVYATGPSRDRVYHVDEHTQTSKLVTKTSTERFTRTSEKIASYYNGQKIYAVLEFTVIGGISLVATAYSASSLDYGTAISFVLLIDEILDVDPEVAATNEALISVPIKDWGYEFELVPTANGYKKTFVIYDDNGDEYDRISFGTVPVTVISPAYR